MRMRATERLGQEHVTVRRMLGELDAARAESPEAAREAFERLIVEVAVHTRLEEEFLYPALLDHEETRDATREALAAHAAVDRLIEALRPLGPADDRFAAALGTLRETLLRHLDDEEARLFPAAERLEGGPRLEQVGEALAARREALARAIDAARTRA